MIVRNIGSSPANNIQYEDACKRAGKGHFYNKERFYIVKANKTTYEVKLDRSERFTKLFKKNKNYFQSKFQRGGITDIVLEVLNPQSAKTMKSVQ